MHVFVCGAEQSQRWKPTHFPVGTPKSPDTHAMQNEDEVLPAQDPYRDNSAESLKPLP